MSPKKTQEEKLRERLQQRGVSKAHGQLIGITQEEDEPAEADQNQNLLQNEKEDSNQSEKHLQNEDETAKANPTTRRRRKPRSKREVEKEKFTNKYQARTFYVLPSLLKRFDKLTGGIRGEKTRMINEALEEYLDTFEDD